MEPSGLENMARETTVNGYFLYELQKALERVVGVNDTKTGFSERQLNESIKASIMRMGREVALPTVQRTCPVSNDPKNMAERFPDLPSFLYSGTHIQWAVRSCRKSENMGQPWRRGEWNEIVDGWAYVTAKLCQDVFRDDGLREFCNRFSARAALGHYYQKNGVKEELMERMRRAARRTILGA